MKAVKITLFVMTLIVFGLFMIGFSMTPAPGASSGNGNPAFFILFALVPLFVVMSLLWWTLLRFYTIRTSAYVIGTGAILIHLAAAFLYRQHTLNAYRDVIRQALADRGGTVDGNYLQSITTGLSFHINNQNFNVNTFLMFLTASILAAIIFRLSDQWDGRSKRRAE
ncbi:hypothetical protein [Domibacillus tundrae]|uniref:hypothetical protein n=1 Tax=Domibacillus tundrae TaxID=1587527 RepID=UPI000618240A|nr:hypothetical protein [Domibacillus tundrae]